MTAPAARQRQGHHTPARQHHPPGWRCRGRQITHTRAGFTGAFEKSRYRRGTRFCPMPSRAHPQRGAERPSGIARQSRKRQVHAGLLFQRPSVPENPFSARLPSVALRAPG